MFDGDADRVLLSDERGELVDGDQILALIARSWARAGRLRGGGVVATVMSNLGFLHAMRRADVAVEQTAVGDRYVLEAMKAAGIEDPNDVEALAILRDVYPDRQVVSVDARPLFERGGGIHCITQQQPAV